MTTFTISEADYVAAQRLFVRPTALKRWMRVGGVAVLIVIALSLSGESAWMVWGGLGGGIASFVAAQVLLVPFMARRNYRSYKGIRSEMDLTLEADGVRYTTADANVLLRWEKILKWREDEAYLLLFHSPRLFNIVPKALGQRGFDVAALQLRLESNVGPAA